VGWGYNFGDFFFKNSSGHPACLLQEGCLHRNLTLAHYYDLKWVDSTHALAVFADEAVAGNALLIKDSSIKLRPFW
jgi:hypothetical protein